MLLPAARSPLPAAQLPSCRRCRGVRAACGGLRPSSGFPLSASVYVYISALAPAHDSLLRFWFLVLVLHVLALLLLTQDTAGFKPSATSHHQSGSHVTRRVYSGGGPAGGPGPVLHCVLIVVLAALSTSGRVFDGAYAYTYNPRPAPSAESVKRAATRAQAHSRLAHRTDATVGGQGSPGSAHTLRQMARPTQICFIPEEQRARSQTRG